jgi:hypothetical protein
VSDGHCAHRRTSQAQADGNNRDGDVELPQRLNLADGYKAAADQRHARHQQGARTDTVHQIAGHGHGQARHQRGDGGAGTDSRSRPAKLFFQGVNQSAEAIYRRLAGDQCDGRRS